MTTIQGVPTCHRSSFDRVVLTILSSQESGTPRLSNLARGSLALRSLSLLNRCLRHMVSFTTAFRPFLRNLVLHITSSLIVTLAIDSELKYEIKIVVA